MSELPRFTEGLIFDVTKTQTTEDNPLIITGKRGVNCLFKIASLDDYSKNYTQWKIMKTSYGGATVSKYCTAKVYNDRSFLVLFDEFFIWQNGIYYWDMPMHDDNEPPHSVTCVRLTDDTQQELNSITFHYKYVNYTPYVTYMSITQHQHYTANGYVYTINNPVTTINWAYRTNESNDELKYYQFLLYNSQNKCVVDTGKVYTNTTTGNGFVCNSLDDKSTYTLVGYCVSQNGQRLDLPDLIIKTAYTTGRIYTNLTIELDKYSARNTVYAEVVNLIGKTTNGNAVFVNGEKIDLKSNDNTVVFTDDYGLLKDNFVIRLWINGIINEGKATILKLANSYNSDYIELYYEDGYFYAIKHSCGLTSRYISNVVDKNDALNGNTYLSMLYCNERIDIYATSYSESEVVT